MYRENEDMPTDRYDTRQKVLYDKDNRKQCRHSFLIPSAVILSFDKHQPIFSVVRYARNAIICMTLGSGERKDLNGVIYI